MAGTRRYTQGLAQARDYADQFTPHELITRTRALGALKKAAPSIGLTLRDLALVDMLFATSEDQDWQTPGIRPVVWPSNDWLCEQTGLSLTSLRRHLRALVDAGVIVPADSQNGKRWGRRSEAGKILAAFGFDLSPIAVRYAEFMELAAAHQARRAERRELEREFTILRRTVQMIVQAGREGQAPGDWEGYAKALERIVAQRRSAPLVDLVNALQDLQILVEETFKPVSNEGEIAPKGAKFGTHILTTTDLALCDSNDRSGVDTPHHQLSGGFAAKGFPKKPVRDGQVAQARTPRGSEENSEIEQIPLGLVMAACPEVASYQERPITTWRDLIAAAEQLRPWLGVSEQAWREARRTLGENLAAVALAVIAQKHSGGQIAKPGGYLRGMTEKALAGELHLARTLHGLSESATALH